MSTPELIDAALRESEDLLSEMEKLDRLNFF
jgi:hypothetical protein